MKLNFTSIVLFSTTLSFAQIGTFDPTFNEGNPYQIQNWNSTGKIVALSNETALNISNYGIPGMPGNSGEEHALIGKLTNLVSSYASAQGIVNPGFSDQFAGFRDFTVDSDGKIVAVGYRQYDDMSYSTIYIGRYNDNGSFDNTFNSGSFQEIDYSTSYYYTDVFKVLQLSSGKIMCIGKRGNGTNMLIRINSDGTIDNTYGTNGIYDWNFMGGSYSKIHDAIELSTGKILVAGSEYDASNSNLQTAFVARINADGTIDNTFGTGGLVKVTLGQNDKASYINSIALASTGEIVVAGMGYWTGSPWDVARGGMVKISAAGVVDNTFGPFYLNADYSGFNKVIVTATDEIIAGGYASFSTVQNSVFVFRSLNGTLNTSFDADGMLTDANLPNPSISDFTLQPDGKLIYVVSTYVDNFNTGLLVGRLLMEDETNSLQVNELNDFTLYPNPASESISLTDLEIGSSLKIIDLTGKVVLETNAFSTTMNLELKEIKNGIYVVQSFNNNKIVSSKKLVVNK